jgi:hypothetical protein
MSGFATALEKYFFKRKLDQPPTYPYICALFE